MYAIELVTIGVGEGVKIRYYGSFELKKNAVEALEEQGYACRQELKPSNLYEKVSGTTLKIARIVFNSAVVFDPRTLS